MFFNRRKLEREIVTDCAMEFSSSGWKCYGGVLDLTEEGMKVEIEEVPTMHEEVGIKITCDSGRKLNKTAAVVWIIKKVPPEEGATIGLKFV